MFYALCWLVVFGLFAFWSFAAWAFHAITAWTLSNAGAMAGTSGAIEALQLPAWLAPWIPPELALAFKSMLAALTPAVQAMLDWAPSLAGGLSVAVWVVWALGSALLVVLGIVFSGAIAVLRGRSTTPGAASVGRAAAR